MNALADANPVALLGYSTHNKLDGITKCGIQQTAQRLAQLGRDLLGGKGQDGGQRHDCQEVEGEDKRWAPLGHAGNDAERNEEQEYIDIVCIDNKNMVWPGEKQKRSSRSERSFGAGDTYY